MNTKCEINFNFFYLLILGAQFLNSLDCLPPKLKLSGFESEIIASESLLELLMASDLNLASR